jgi:UDP-glucose 4-epimerase
MPDARSLPAILLTGATGRVGRLCARDLAHHLAPGARLLRQTRNAPPGRDWLHWSLRPGQPPTFTADPPSVPVVLHLAGATPRPGRVVDFDANRRLALAVAAWARTAGVRHLFVASSAAIYGIPGGGAALAENAPCAPLSPYGRSKFEMEAAVMAAKGGTGPAVTFLRIGNVAGADQLLGNVARAGPRNPILLDRLSDGSSPRRSYIGPQALARVLAALSLAALRGTELPTVLNIAAPGAVEMAALLGAYATHRPIATHDRPAPRDVLPILDLDTRRLCGLHAFAPEDSTPAGIVGDWLGVRECAA